MSIHNFTYRTSWGYMLLKECENFEDYLGHLKKYLDSISDFKDYSISYRKWYKVIEQIYNKALEKDFNVKDVLLIDNPYYMDPNKVGQAFVIDKSTKLNKLKKIKKQTRKNQKKKYDKLFDQINVPNMSFTEDINGIIHSPSKTLNPMHVLIKTKIEDESLKSYLLDKMHNKISFKDILLLHNVDLRLNEQEYNELTPALQTILSATTLKKFNWNVANLRLKVVEFITGVFIPNDTNSKELFLELIEEYLEIPLGDPKMISDYVEKNMDEIKMMY